MLRYNLEKFVYDKISPVKNEKTDSEPDYQILLA